MLRGAVRGRSADPVRWSAGVVPLGLPGATPEAVPDPTRGVDPGRPPSRPYEQSELRGTQMNRHIRTIGHHRATRER